MITFKPKEPLCLRRLGRRSGPGASAPDCYDIEFENGVVYFDDLADPSKAASAPRVSGPSSR
jgi:hypothetical protein